MIHLDTDVGRVTLSERGRWESEVSDLVLLALAVDTDVPAWIPDSTLYRVERLSETIPGTILDEREDVPEFDGETVY